MDKDEMKNKISMALKDPILQQGFEIICKENTELKLKLEVLEGQTPWKNIKDKSKLIKRLNKAKEILAKLLEEENNNMYWEMDGSDKSSYYKARKQAKQFLKETE